jgi:prolyl-tRNA editing enzyme YbaK/EbsC (Cys-tRNA(Pro) deacylase)
MSISLGTLTFLPALESQGLLAQTVFNTLTTLYEADRIGVAEIDASLSDTAAFCEHYKIEAHKAANCVILEAKRAERNWLAACVVLASTRADINGIARRALDARKVSFAPMERTVSESLMEYGAITPVGLPNGWSILIDSAVAEAPYVIIGSGIRKSKLAIPGSVLASLPNAQIIPGLGRTAL